MDEDDEEDGDVDSEGSGTTDDENMSCVYIYYLLFIISYISLIKEFFFPKLSKALPVAWKTLGAQT